MLWVLVLAVLVWRRRCRTRVNPACSILHRVLGGTFEPIHDGHLALGQAACDLLKLDRVIFVPAARPPHKVNDRVTDAETRSAMVELAIAGNPNFCFAASVSSLPDSFRISTKIVAGMPKPQTTRHGRAT